MYSCTSAFESSRESRIWCVNAASLEGLPAGCSNALRPSSPASQYSSSHSAGRPTSKLNESNGEQQGQREN